MKYLYALWAWLTGKNPCSLPPDMIVGQLNEPRSLPLGKTEFAEWSKRIIAGALIPNEDGLCVYHDEDKATPEQREKLEIFEVGQLFTLSDLLLHLGPTESHKPDAFFIHSLRKFAVNQVAITMRKLIKEEHDKTKAAKDAKPKEQCDNLIESQAQ